MAFAAAPFAAAPTNACVRRASPARLYTPIKHRGTNQSDNILRPHREPAISSISVPQYIPHQAIDGESRSPTRQRRLRSGGSGRHGGSHSCYPARPSREQTLQERLSVAMIAMQHELAPGASDKWKSLQLFHDSIPKHLARVEHIERVASPERFARFCDSEEIDGWHGGVNQLSIGFYAVTKPSTLQRLRTSGFSRDDVESIPGGSLACGGVSISGVPVYSQSSAAHDRLLASGLPPPVAASSLGADEDELSFAGGTRAAEDEEEMIVGRKSSKQADHLSAYRLCVVLCSTRTLGRGIDIDQVEEGDSSFLGSSGGSKLHCVTSPARLFVAYILSYSYREPVPSTVEAEPLVATRHQERRHTYAKQQQREYARVRDALVKVALQGLDQLPPYTVNTTLLSSTSLEAESVIELYLLGGGASRSKPKAHGISPREALGSVVVQRIDNAYLYKEYLEQGSAAHSYTYTQTQVAEGVAESSSVSVVPMQRYREDLVWHGTRLKQMDGENTSLATKLRSIAENGFDPQRCEKGAAAEGGIWVALSPLASFGHGCDGLVAFVLCLAKTHFNEWMGSTCARVLQRERVLPLYSLVHA